MLLFILLIIIPDLLDAQQITQSYKRSACGLNFIHRSAKITTRESNPAGNPTPLTFNITELGNCRRVEKAFVWFGLSYRNAAGAQKTVTISNPEGNTSTINAAIIGTHGHKCWGEVGTRAYRADVTSMITGNGNYIINLSSDNWETDGLTFVIVYRDLQANYEGHIQFDDGLITVPTSNTTTSHTMTNINACGNSVTASGFMVVADLQRQFNTNEQANFNFNGTNRSLQANFWNSEVSNTNVTQGQNNYSYSITPGVDCYSLIMTGLYYRTTTCSTCPEILAVNAAASTTTICSGDDITLTGSGANNYQWTSIPVGFTSNQRVVTLSPTSTRSYVLRGTTSDGCQVGFDTIRVNVNPAPRVNAGPNLNLCINDTVLIGNPATDGTAPYNYSWSPPNGLSSTNQARVNASPTVTTSYIVRVTDSRGCIVSDTIRIVVNDRPSINAGDDQTICNTNSVRIGNIATSGTAPYSYNWQPATGLSNSNIATPDASPSDTTNYIVTVTDANGCTDSDTIRINVLPSPTPNAGQNTEICFGESVQIGGNATGGTPSYIYSWTPALGLSDPNISSPIASPQATTQYVQAVTDQSGCTSYDSVTVTVNPLPIADAGDNTEICFGDVISIGSNAVSGTAPYVYSWQPATGLSSSTDAVVNASPTVTTTYKLTVTDSKGCTTTDSINIIVHELPQPVITPSGSVTICSCDSIVLDAGGPFSSYLWSTGETTRSITVRDPGIYVVTVTNEFGCINSSPRVDLTVLNPMASVSVPNNLSGMPGDQVTIPLVLNSSEFLDECNARNFVAYLRYNRSILVPSGSTPKGTLSSSERMITITGNRSDNTILANLDFIVTLGDTTFTNIYVDSLVWTDCVFNANTENSVFNLDGLCYEGGTVRLFKSGINTELLSVRPHPVNNKAEIVLRNSDNVDLKINLINIYGEEVKTVFNGSLMEGESIIPAEFKDITTGTYFLVISTANSKITRIIEIIK